MITWINKRIYRHLASKKDYFIHSWIIGLVSKEDDRIRPYKHPEIDRHKLHRMKLNQIELLDHSDIQMLVHQNHPKIKFNLLIIF